MCIYNACHIRGLKLLIDVFFYSTDHLLIPNVKKDLLQTLPVIVHIPPHRNLTPLNQVTHHALHHRVILIEVDLQVIHLIPDLCLQDLHFHRLAVHHRLISSQGQKTQGTCMIRLTELHM